MIGTSLSSRLSLLLQLMTFAVIFVFAVSSLWLTARVLQREELALLQGAAHHLAIEFDRELEEEGDPARAAADALDEEAASGFRIDILDAAGRTLASSARGPSGSDLQRAVAHSARGATVVASVSSRLRSATVAALGRALLAAAIPLFLLTFFVSRRLIKGAVWPLRDMERRARDASGEEAMRSIGPAFGLAEVDALRDSFDRLLARRDDLLQSERRFTSDASHELRTPLTVLSGELEMALARSDLSPGLRCGLERASDQVQTMRELVESLLLLRRAGSEQRTARDGFEPVNLSDLATEIGRAVTARDSSRGTDLSVSGPDEVLVLGHPVLLASALRNLIDNAMKFTLPGEPIRVSVESDHDQAEVTVDDGGSGIPEAERERIFDPFFRGSEARAGREGTGLGLPILRQVARAHGGDVSAAESPLGGARLVLRLPLLVDGGSRPHKGRSQKTVLILALSLWLAANSDARAHDGIRGAGDVLQLALPASAVALTLPFRDRRGALEFCESAAATLGLTYGLKDAVHERRPNGGTHSFPSGHTSISFCSAEFMRRRYGWRIGLPAFTAASFVAYSRVESKAHYVHDVLAGAAIGAIGAEIFSRPYRGWRLGTGMGNGGRPGFRKGAGCGSSDRRSLRLEITRDLR